MNVRIARRSNDQRGTADVPQTVLHPIAIHHPVAFSRHLAGAQGVDHEAMQQIDIFGGVEWLPACPELGEMGTVAPCFHIIDDACAVVLGAAREFPFAAVERGVSVSGSLSGNEIADKAGESLRHLIGKRHHAS